MMMLGRLVSLLTRPFVLASNWRWENKHCGECAHLRKEHFSYAGFCQVGEYKPGIDPCRCKAFVSRKGRRT